MAYEKTWRAMAPVARSLIAQDRPRLVETEAEAEEFDRPVGAWVPGCEPLDDRLVWLMRESFQRQAESNGLVLTDFQDLGEMASADVSPNAERDLGLPASEMVVRVFEGTARKPVA